MKTLLTAALTALLLVAVMPAAVFCLLVLASVCLLGAVCYGIVVAVSWWLFEAYDVQVTWLGTADAAPTAPVIQCDNAISPQCANNAPPVVLEAPHDPLAVLATELAWERVSPRQARKETARRVNLARSAKRNQERETGVISENTAETVQSAACEPVALLTVKRRIARDQYQKGTRWIIEAKGCSSEDATTLSTFWEGQGWEVRVA